MKHQWAMAAVLAVLVSASASAAVVTVFQGSAPDAAGLTGIRDDFRTAIGGGTAAGPNGSFGGVRREINWDGVPDARADPNLLPADFFNVNSPRGAVFDTPGTGFMVSSNPSTAQPPLFGFASDFQTFSPNRLFSALNSSITDVNFFLAGTSTPAVTTAFGVIFVDVELADVTKLEFFDQTNSLIFSQTALVAGNQGLTFLGGVVSGGEISRVRITSGNNTLVSNGVLGSQVGDIVVMDDFLYAEPRISRLLPEPSSLLLVALAACFAGARVRRTARA